VKLSGSLKMHDSCRVNTVRIIIMIANPKMSFTVKKGWNGILSVFLSSPSGLLVLLGVEIISGLILLLQLQMVFGSGVRRIV
jgi:hypothetical protein